MNLPIKLAAAGLLATATAATGQSPDPEGELERALAGRVADRPVQCLALSRIRSSTVIDGTAILYRVGTAIYVNRPRAGAERLDRDDMIVNRSASTRLCRGDPVSARDPHSGAYRAAIILGEFVPYHRAG